MYVLSAVKKMVPCERFRFANRSTTPGFKMLSRITRPSAVLKNAYLPKVYLRYASTPLNAFDKYKSKLEKKAGELGAKDVDELKEKLKNEIETKKKEMNLIDPLKELEEYERRQAEEVKRLKQNEGTGVRGAIDKNTPKLPYKTLSSYMAVEKLHELPLKEIELLWRARFAKKERSLQAVIQGEQFGTIFANAFKNPNFILPLPKGDDGYEMHFVQWNFVGKNTTHCMLTSLAEYQLHKEYAKPHTTLLFHQELLENKELVLMNGEVEADVPLTMDEAQLLVLNVQRFYGGLKESKATKEKVALLRDFTSGNPNFDMKKLIEQAASFD